MRAREPDFDGYIERDGVKVAYEVFGNEHPTTICFSPGNPMAHSRWWRVAVPMLARRHRVITIDPRGNGRSDRPSDPELYGLGNAAHDTIAVLDALEVDKAVLIGLSMGCLHCEFATVMAPDRVAGLVLIGGVAPIVEPFDLPHLNGDHFYAPLADYTGMDVSNHAFMTERYDEFVQTWMALCVSEPHEHYAIERGVGFAHDTDGETLALAYSAVMQPGMTGRDTGELLDALFRDIRCPVLLINGSEDPVAPVAWAEEAASRYGWDLLVFEGGGHVPAEPIRKTLAIREFAERVLPRAPRRTTFTRAQLRPKKALFISSPIGLGHARRDLAIANELRRRRPDLEVDWLTQHPVTAMLERAGERVHPAAAHLASESAHIEGESAEHDLHVYQAARSMDEILVANFHVFHDLLDDEHYDVVVGDEAWDVDFFLHDNPELKHAPFVWMTDFVGMLPMPDGGDREEFLTADWNEEMIEQVGRFPQIRDRSIFVGNPDDIPPDRLGPSLPTIRDWTAEHFAFAGYVSGFDPLEVADREAVRDALGWHPDERVCVVSVGGTSVGAPLLRRVISAFPAARDAVPGLRMVVVAGPRIAPESLVDGDLPEGLEISAFVPDLYRQFAACDLGVVQGGLTTTMELVANQRPFLYFPIEHHFEQQLLVPYRLARYGAGRRMEYATSDSDVIAAAIADEVDREVAYLPVESDGAARAADLIAELL
jgi:pimeloyl-ACP methyl ester carboxylesterase